MLDAAIVGAGPYGLSIAAHLRHRGIRFRIFGRPMDSWASHMPEGMLLKSDGFASNICDGPGEFTLEHFCAEHNTRYAHVASPVRRDTFVRYGMAFQQRFLPDLDQRLVTSLDKQNQGFRLTLEDGETVLAKRVVLAIGITNFKYVPDTLANLPAEFVSHSFDHRDLTPFKGKKILVIGGGSSATDLAALLLESGADVQLVARDSSLKFHNKPDGKPRSIWQRIRNPRSGLGLGWKSYFYSYAPTLFHCLPQGYRLKTVRTHLGPSGGWFVKEKVMGQVPMLLGCKLAGATVEGGKAHIAIRNSGGNEQQITVDHVIAATGYKVDLGRLLFLSDEIRQNLRHVNGTPILSSKFQSSVPGLYFVGLAAANSFGPLMRFAYGARFAALRISAELAKSATKVSEPVPVVRAAANAD